MAGSAGFVVSPRSARIDRTNESGTWSIPVNTLVEQPGEEFQQRDSRSTERAGPLGPGIRHDPRTNRRNHLLPVQSVELDRFQCH